MKPVCKEGYLHSQDSVNLFKAGYQKRVVKALRKRNRCVPKLCLWFFPDKLNANQHSFFNNKNYFLKNYGCVCDYEGGWVSSKDKSFCVPVFDLSGHAAFQKNSLHRALSRFETEEHQTTYHRYSVNKTLQLASHIENILQNQNTAKVNEEQQVALLKDLKNCDVIVRETGVLGLNKKFKENVSLLKLDKDYNEFLESKEAQECGKANETMPLCSHDGGIILNRKYALKNNVNSIWWKADTNKLRLTLS